MEDKNNEVGSLHINLQLNDGDFQKQLQVIKKEFEKLNEIQIGIYADFNKHKRDALKEKVAEEMG